MPNTERIQASVEMRGKQIRDMRELIEHVASLSYADTDVADEIDPEHDDFLHVILRARSIRDALTTTDWLLETE